MDIIKSHFKDDGGLSYSHDGTQSGYYGAKVSRGFQNIGDLHGTKLYSWSLSIVSDLLEWKDKIKFKLPCNINTLKKKIFINRKVVKGPWGGENSFMGALCKFLEKNYELTTDIDSNFNLALINALTLINYEDIKKDI